MGDVAHTMLFGGSRSGKTFLLIFGIVARALKAPGSRHAVLRFRFAHVKQSIVHDTFPKVMSLCFPDVKYELNKTDWFASLPNDSEIWFGGLDDKDRTEKILGSEYATILLNECSQITFEARNTAMTRLAQNVKTLDGGTLPLRMWYDCNPPSNAHWSYRLFQQKVDPDSKRALPNGGDYGSMQMNPVHNAENLPESYLQTLASLPGRHRRRFLEGEFSDANPSALFAQENIDRWRVMDGKLPDMQRIVVAVDPSGASDADNAANDEIGIAVCGVGTDGKGYLLEDLTMKDAPAVWGTAAVAAFDRHDADRIVAETNFGGGMVEHVIKTAAKGRRLPFSMLHASRGKVVRAEPISALYEDGTCRHVGNFPELEDELCAMTTFGYVGEGSPNRADAVVWGFSELFPGIVSPRKKEPGERKKKQPRRRHNHGWMAA